MRNLKIILPVAFCLEAMYSVAPNLLAMIMLRPAEYGAFSLQYVIFAFGSTLVLSTVSEPWSRRRVTDGFERAGAFPIVTGLIAILTAILTLILALATQHGLTYAICAAVGVSLSVFRGGVRYRTIALGQYRRAVAADLMSIAIAMISLCGILGLTEVGNAEAIFFSWGMGSLIAVPFLAPKPDRIRSSLTFWFCHYRREMKTLLQDSFIAMLNNTVAPFILAPVLGIANFGLFRSMENITAVLRLMVSGLRPLIPRRGLTYWMSRRVLALMTYIAILAGVGVFVGLGIIQVWGLELGTLTSLSEFKIFAGLVVVGTGLANLLSTIARTYLSQGSLLRARVITVSVAVTAPLVGAATFGIVGAFSGLLIERVSSTVVWRHVMIREN